jgi:hypothetical protein
VNWPFSLIGPEDNDNLGRFWQMKMAKYRSYRTKVGFGSTPGTNK